MYIASTLIFVNDVEVDAETFKSIDANDIQAFQVLRSTSAIELFGERGKNGVIIVTLRDE